MLQPCSRPRHRGLQARDSRGPPKTPDSRLSTLPRNHQRCQPRQPSYKWSPMPRNLCFGVSLRQFRIDNTRVPHPKNIRRLYNCTRIALISPFPPLHLSSRKPLGASIYHRETGQLSGRHVVIMAPTELGKQYMSSGAKPAKKIVEPRPSARYIQTAPMRLSISNQFH